MLTTAIQLESQGNVRRALDALFQHIDDMAKAEKILFMDEVDISSMGSHLLIGLLVITRHEDHPSRVRLAFRIRDRLNVVAPLKADRLLEGLE